MYARTLLVLTALVAAPLAAQDDKAPSHLLRLAFKPGSSHFHRQAMEMHMAMKMGDQNMETTMKMEMTIETKVGDVQDGKAAMEQTVRRIKVAMQGPVAIEYDSDDETSDPGPLAQVVDILGQAIKLRIDERGQVSDVKLPEGFAGGTQMFGDDMKGFFNQAMPNLPDQRVEIGGTWDTSIDMPLGAMGSGKVKVKNKLLKVEGGKASVEQIMQIDTDALELPAGAKMEVKKATGTSVIDLATGMPASTTADMTMQMSMGQAGAMDMVMKMTMEAIEPPAPKPKKGDADKAKDGGK